MNNLNVYIKEITKPYNFKKQPHGNFKSYLLENEKIEIIEFMLKKGSHLFNGEVTRLDRFIEYRDCIDIYISPLTYFDSLVTNMLYHKYFEKVLELGDTKEERIIKSSICRIAEAGVFDFESIIDNENLANTIAVSCLIADASGRYGLVSRNQKVAIGKGLMGVTVTGAVDGIDYVTDDPILSCVKREAKEELGVMISDAKVRSIVISSKKLQPIFIVDAFINDTWENILRAIPNSTDFSSENENFHIVPPKKLMLFAQSYPMTDAARYHLIHCNKNIS